MVVLPEPVGPVTSMVPYGLLYDSSYRRMLAAWKPSSDKRSSAVFLSRIRMTTFSPLTVGRVATRRSTGRPSIVVLIRPSWGIRRSAMLMSAMTLSRLIMPFWMFRGERITSWSTPSIR